MRNAEKVVWGQKSYDLHYLRWLQYYDPNLLNPPDELSTRCTVDLTAIVAAVVHNKLPKPALQQDLKLEHRDQNYFGNTEKGLQQ